MIPFLENKKLGTPLPENKKVTTFPFHVFDRYEIHIQAFLDSINGKIIIFRSSSSQNKYINIVTK